MNFIRQKVLVEIRLNHVKLSLDEYFAANWHGWLRWLIVIAVLSAAMLFGLVSANFRRPEIVIIAALVPFLLVGLNFILRHFYLTPVIVLLIALFVPISLPTGTGSRLVLSLIATVGFVGIWILEMFVKRKFELVPSSVNRPILAFMAVTGISILWSILFRDPLVFTPASFPLVQIAAAMVMVMLPAALLLVGNFVDSQIPLKWMAIVMLLAGVFGLFHLFLDLPIPVNTNGMFNLWVIGLSFGLGIFYDRLGLPVRISLLALSAAYVFWGFVQNISWLAGWLPGMVAIGVLSVLRSKKLAGVLLLALMFLIISDSNYYLGRVVKNESQESGYTRLEAWASNWGITKDHLLFGTGPAGYAVYYMSYFPENAMATHSNYIDILAQTGIVGLSLVLWFFGALAWKGYQVSRRLRGRGDLLEALANVAFAGTLACIVIMGFGDWLFPFAYTQTIAGFDYAVFNWLFMGMILVIDRLTQSNGLIPVD